MLASSGPRSPLRERLLSCLIIGLSALWVGGAGWWWGTRSAGSADAHGYISQAALWLDRDLIVPVPMATTVPWDDAEWTFAPLGYRPGVARGTLVPVYPAGLPLVMAAAEAVGGRRAIYLVVPLFGMLAVLASASLATRLASPAAGAIAALSIASSPTFLFSLMWPMSDVPASALWAVGLVLATGAGLLSAGGAGVAIGLAVLTRPNLVLVSLAPVGYLLWRATVDRPARRRELDTATDRRRSHGDRLPGRCRHPHLALRRAAGDRLRPCQRDLRRVAHRHHGVGLRHASTGARATPDDPLPCRSRVASVGRSTASG